VTQSVRQPQQQYTPPSPAARPQSYTPPKAASHAQTPHAPQPQPQQPHHSQSHPRPQAETLSRPAQPSSQPRQAHAFQKSVQAMPSTASMSANRNSLDEQTTKTLLISAVGFMIFFAVLAATVLLSQRATHNEAQQTEIFQQAGNQANVAAQKLDTQLAWVDQALATRGNAKQIVDLVARGTDVQGALVVSADNTLLASTPNAESAAASIPVQDFPKAGVKIISLISDSGAVSPVIIRRAGKAYLAVILTPSALIDYKTARNALILTGGGIIDAPAEMGRIGGLAYLGLSAERLNALKNSRPIDHSVSGDKTWLSVRTIPNSDSIAVVSLKTKTNPPDWTKNLLTFLTMLIGTGLLFWIMFKNLLRQISRAEDTKHLNEVSEQRYRAALEGNRGGIFEINVTKNSAYLSGSLSELLGLSPKEQEISLPQFLGLFREGDRERLYSVTRRAHVGGGFEIDLNIAHLPVTP